MNPIVKAFSYENFKVIIEHAPVGIVIIDKEFNWLLTNKRFSEITGYSPKELEGLTFLDITHKDDISNNLNLYEQLTSGKVKEYVYEKRYVRKNGKVVWVRLTVTSVLSGGNYAYMIALIQDIEETRKYQRNLEFRNKELDTLFYKASHDLKAPVASLEGLCHLLSQEASLAKSKTLEHLEATVKKLKHQNEFLLQLATISELTVHIVKIPFTSMVNSSLEGNESLVELEVKSKVTEINSDLFLLRTVFKNLFDNAILYADQKPKVTVALSLTKTGYQITFRDDGPGIDEELREHVFDMFFKGSEKSKGSGLGLYTVKKAVEKLKGEIEIQAHDGTGCLFRITLPFLLLSEL